MLNEFQADESGGEVITVEKLDELIREMKRLDDEKDAQKEVLAGHTARYEDARSAVLSALKSVGKSKYYVDGLGTAFVATRYSFKTPKETSEKAALYDYITATHGEDVLGAMVSINSMTLNAFCKKELEAALDKGDADFLIPGVGAPTAEEKVNFRKG